MPFRSNTNNRILPANARAADVAEKAVKEIIPVQQRRAYSAFRVQGIQCVHYNRLSTGRKCPCESTQKQINGILGKDGKASQGAINAMLTGNMEFNVTPYNFDQKRVTKNNTQSSPLAPVNKNQGVFDIMSDGDEIPFADLLNGRKSAVGDNGPVESIDIDELVGDFDAGYLGFSDVACPICFGTGYIGGYQPYHGHRQVLAIPDLQLTTDCDIDLTVRPMTATGTGFSVIVTLPLGAIGVDVFRVWDMANPTGAAFTIDGTAVNSTTDILAKCDGKRHVLSATNCNRFTHLEIQFTLTTESVYFEFPKRPSSSNTDLLEQDEPFNIIMSPNVPTMNSQDVIVESQWGKVLIVQNVNPWNSRDRNVLGWEAQVRVIQPQEMFRILPTRGRVMNRDATTEMVRDNQLGPFRT